MHNAALSHDGLPYSYVRLHISPAELAEAIGLLGRLPVIGVNLTIPHKAAALSYLHHVDPHARQLGVVNTIAFHEGSSRGFNTDAPGLARAIQGEFQVRMGQCRTMIIGAGGGAGRAAAMQCVWEGCPSVILVNRTLSKAEALARELKTLAASDSPDVCKSEVSCVSDHDPGLADLLKQVDLVVQCSSLGMGDGDPSPLPAAALHPGLLIYDTIYSRKTQLLIDAQHAGARCADGLSMLLHQGALAFEIWFQRPAPVQVMQEALRKAVRH
jgi:shikimate dehydrogenase